MAQFIFRNIRHVEFDLSSINIGESIFGNEKDIYTLCVKISETEWEVFNYNIITHDLSSVKIENPNYYISVYNEVFDESKTEWVKEYFELVRTHLNTVQNFEYALKDNFM